MNNRINFLFITCILLIVSCATENSINIPNVVDEENLDASGLPIMTFVVQQPTITNTTTYTIDVIEWDIPNDYTNAIKLRRIYKLQ